MFLVLLFIVDQPEGHAVVQYPTLHWCGLEGHISWPAPLSSHSHIPSPYYCLWEELSPSQKKQSSQDRTLHGRLWEFPNIPLWSICGSESSSESSESSPSHPDESHWPCSAPPPLHHSSLTPRDKNKVHMPSQGFRGRCLGHMCSGSPLAPYPGPDSGGPR